MRKIVTHNNPHLDEIACIWLIRRFLSGWADARVAYIPTNPSGGRVIQPDARPDTMYIGVGRGKFDEHKGNIEDSATTLVFKHVCAKRRAKFDPITAAALAELIAFVNDEDHGRHIDLPFAEFGISAALAYAAKEGKSTSKQILETGLIYLDGVLACLIEKHQLERDWKRVTMFKTPWGAAAALETTVSAKSALRRAMHDGADIVVVVNPKTKFRSIRAAASTAVDLTQPFEECHAREPKAEWYLHHSKRMLICGSDVAENKSLSSMSLKTLIGLISL